MKRIQDEFRRIVIVSLLALSTPTFGQSVTGDITRIGDATHLEFSGKDHWEYEADFSDDNILTLTVPAFDDKTLIALQSWSDKFISKVEVDTKGPDKNYIVKFKMASDKVEMFDYLTDEPSRLILDFYQKAPEKKPEPVAKNKATASKKVTALPEKKKAGDTKYKNIKRGIASTELIQLEPVDLDISEEEKKAFYPQNGIFDSNDPNYSRFIMKDYQVKEESVIASEQNIYIRFPYLKMSIDRFAEMMQDRPIYEIKPTKTEENKEARLLQKLYEKNRFASFKKVYKHFVDNYPKSKYSEIIHNIAAEVHIDKYMSPLESNTNVDEQKLDRTMAYNRFRAILKLTLEKFPQSPLDERNRLLLAYSALRKGEALEALRFFDQYLKKYPLTDEKYRVNIARSEAFLLLKKPDEAKEVLASLESDATKKELAVEAAYRLGDVQMEFGNYEDAQKVYIEKLSKYPEYKSIYPNALYNLSESYFWNKEYKQSLDTFVEFLKFYPAHEHGGFALTRVGELLDILGADQRQIMGAFIESYFRYPKSAGASVARVRMLTGALRNMKSKQKKIALQEMNGIIENSSLPQIDEFTTLMISDGLSKGQDYRESLERLEKFYRDNPRAANFGVFKKRILRNVADILNKEVEEKDYIAALDFHGKYTPTWLKQSDRLDTEYLKAFAYEMSGVYKPAEKIYEKLEARLRKIAGTKEHKERKVLEYLPTLDSVRLRLASVALEQGEYRQAYSQIKKIKKELTDEEKIEKVQIGAEVAEQNGDKLAAISYLQSLIKSWQGEPELLAEPLVKVGKLYLERNQISAAADAVNSLDALPKETYQGREQVQANAIQLKADTLLAQGKRNAAVKSYLELLDKFESKRPLESVRYKAGNIKFEDGEVKEAEMIWSPLQAKKDNLYARLAAEKLSQANWQDSYKKYIDRIPAAKELK